MKHRLAVVLLRDHQKKVASSVARQMARTVPRYELLDDEVLYRSVDQLLSALTDFLDTKRSENLDRMVQDMVQLRRISGFAPAELLMAGMCFFPVLRRFFIRKAERSRIGLELYDEVEKALFPVFVRLALRLSTASTVAGDDAFAEVTFSNLPDFRIEEVSDDDGARDDVPFDPSFS